MVTRGPSVMEVKEKVVAELRDARAKLDHVLGRASVTTTRAELVECASVLDEVIRATERIPYLTGEDLREASALIRASLAEVGRRIRNYP